MTHIEIEKLKELQEIDLELDALDDRERSLPERERYEALESRLKECERALRDKEAELRDRKAAQKRIEDEIAGLNEKMEKEQKRLYGGEVTSPKELAGIQQELESLKERIDQAETSLLEQMEIVEPMEKEIAIIAEKVDRLRAETAEAKSAYGAVSSEITLARAALREKRAVTVTGVVKDQLELYERIRKRHRRAVVELKNSICGGCRTEIPTVELKRIMEEPGPSRCPNCGRILIKEKR